MELLRHLSAVGGRHRGCAVTIGNFDGVHRGHQSIISQLKVVAGQHGLPTLVIIFEPQPQEYFTAEVPPPRLTRFREKVAELSRLDIDYLLCLKFDQGLAELSPREFVQQLLVSALDIRYLVLGDDFRFGRDRQGDFMTLQQMADEFNYQLLSAETFLLQGSKVSSTMIRTALEQDDLSLAQQLLGRGYALSGRVISGDQRGIALGFPTANMAIHRMRCALSGVYVTCVDIDSSEAGGHQAVTSVGVNPMFGGQELRIETHILDFDRQIYGRYMRVEFLKKLRAEQTFPVLEDMITAINSDIQDARQYFAR